jgi:hypothetical protein
VAFAGAESGRDRGARFPFGEAGVEGGVEESVGNRVTVAEPGAAQLTDPEGGAIEGVIARTCWSVTFRGLPGR